MSGPKAFGYLEASYGTVKLKKHVMLLDNSMLFLDNCVIEDSVFANVPSIMSDEKWRQFIHYFQRTSRYPMSTYHLGQLAFWGSEFRLAISYLSSLPAEKASSVTSFMLGCAKWNLGQTDEAVEIWRSTTNALHYFMKYAFIAEYERDYETAERYYFIATRVDPSWSEAKSGYWFAYCMNLLEKPNMDEIDLAVREAIQRNAGVYRRQLRLGKMLMQNKEFELAKLALSSATEMEPQSHWPRYFLGITYFNQHQYELAEVQFNKVIEIKKDFARGYHWLARTLVQLDRGKEALLHYREAIQLLPEDQSLIEEFQTFESRLQGETNQ